MGGKAVWEGRQCGRVGSGHSSSPESAAHYVTSRPVRRRPASFPLHVPVH